MPSATTHDDEDPVVASFDVFMTEPLPKPSQENTETASSSKLFVLQYPAHRRASKPYAAERLQKPTSFRLKAHTGIVEVDVPFLTNTGFNNSTGKNFGQVLAESRVSQMGGSHGLAGGFASGPSVAQNINLNDIPQHGDQINSILSTQTLGGKVVAPRPLDPVYMLGSFRNDELHLTHLDAVVQLRPQLHHIDAQEEIAQRKSQASTASGGKSKVGFEAPPSKIESRAIELKMKENKEDFKDRNLNNNALQLRKIQAEQWRSHEWIDQDDKEPWEYVQTHPVLKQLGGNHLPNEEIPTKLLQSMMSNDEWLDKMSVPREDGKKGLRAKLKGRDRERARRKKVENQRRQMSNAPANAVEVAEISSDSDTSSAASDRAEIDTANQQRGTRQIKIKEEPAGPAAATAVAAAVPSKSGTAAATSQTAKKRGRPKKS